MNYQRIYDELISDRRLNQPPVDEYVEVHHIVPRCFGGSNEQGNLIRLKPEDHFFAHLLLAKIHGGLMWSAVNVMAVTSGVTGHMKRRRKPKMRVLYASAKRWAKANLSGLNGQNTDLKVYHWRNVDGSEEKLTRVEMGDKYGIKLLSLAAVVIGRIKSTKGWYLPSLVPGGVVGNDALRGIESASSDKTEYELHHIDGRVVRGKRRALICEYGINPDSLDAVFAGRSKSANGWFLPDRHSKDDVGRATGERHHGFDPTIYDLIHVDGRKESSTLFSMRQRYGGHRSGWLRISSGGTCRGWCLPTSSHHTKGASFRFTHTDGAVLRGTQADIVSAYGVTRSQASRIAKGRTMMGWSAASDNNKHSQPPAS